MLREKTQLMTDKTRKTAFGRGGVPRISGNWGLMEKERSEVMARKREREEEPAKPDGKTVMGDLLVEKVLEKLDLAELAGGMAPSLAGRLLWSLNMDVLSEKVLDTLAVNLANNKPLMDEIATQMLKRLKVSETPEI